MNPQKLLLQQTVNHIHPLSEEDFEAFYALFRPYTAKRKEVLTQAGSVEKYLYFVLEGLQRLYYLDEQHREATLVFSYQANFGGVLDSMMNQKPSRYYYETLSPSVFLRASYAQIEELLINKPAIEVLLRKGLTGAFSGILERLVELQCFSSEEKFQQLLRRSPHILQIVPHKYLANYIGIDPSNFSKLINSVKI
ncbi:Crp/Fnr family transcriptional regulator [Arcicella sp. DC2W]|uniref:Crp/Fnr family transcriptional regulator n=1 Tax=Arcicella gelida TaxID=2984195 RepID=A0ABU5SBL2_9BACT|nr:Crp/Fnr family transcriptional regulator [Arcicella sp. DC2W]MEA5405863.1 Crp/Fnr family transcriptional regulator [Arcicella sp. DC2W]